MRGEERAVGREKLRMRGERALNKWWCEGWGGGTASKTQAEGQALTRRGALCVVTKGLGGRAVHWGEVGGISISWCVFQGSREQDICWRLVGYEEGLGKHREGSASGMWEAAVAARWSELHYKFIVSLYSVIDTVFKVSYRCTPSPVAAKRGLFTLTFSMRTKHQ